MIMWKLASSVRARGFSPSCAERAVCRRTKRSERRLWKARNLTRRAPRRGRQGCISPVPNGSSLEIGAWAWVVAFEIFRLTSRLGTGGGISEREYRVNAQLTSLSEDEMTILRSRVEQAIRGASPEQRMAFAERLAEIDLECERRLALRVP